MRNMNEVTENVEKKCTGCVAGTMVGGVGAFVAGGLLFPLGAIILPIAATTAVVGGTIGKHIDKKRNNK